ncbi:hypothetical protein Tco_0601808 [Tanacetum coccineum]
MIQWRDLPRNIPLDRVEVLCMIEKRSKVRMGIMPTETELALKQSQQGVSYEVSIVDIEKVAVRSSLRSPNNKCAPIDSQAVIKSPTHYPYDNCQNIRVIVFSIHSDDGNPSIVNIKQLCDRMFDFPIAKLELHHAYDFFTAEPIPGLAEAPDNMNR